METGKLGLK